jgi:AcrR family transcriptional regulator
LSTAGSTTPYDAVVAPIFDSTTTLPRGRHKLSADEVASSQRTRIMGALVDLTAEVGYRNVTVGEIASRARVSRSAFYAAFADTEACLIAAYDVFAETLLVRMAARVDDDADWYALVAAVATEYLTVLTEDPSAARTFLVEMDAAGADARAKQRATHEQFAAFLQARHEEFRAAEPTLGPLAPTIFLGLTLGVRALVCDQLAREAAPTLTDLAPHVLYWITSTIEGAAAAHARFGG